MFCNQCEQTAKGQGCDKMGVCGKTPEVAALQDLLTHSVKGLSLYAHAGRKVGVVDGEVNRFTCEAIFSTLTNVDFDPARFVAMIERCDALKERLKGKVKAAGGQVAFGKEPEAGFLTKVARMFLGGEQPDFTQHPEISFSAAGRNQLVPMGEKVGFAPKPDANADLESLRQILTYGLRGVAAYADHAAILGKESDEV